MRLQEVLAMMSSDSKISLGIITPTGGLKSSQIMTVSEAIERYHMNMPDRVLHIEPRYDYHSNEEILSHRVFTRILISMLWRYRDER